MLTDKEKRWLEFRKDVCFRCKKRRQTCSPVLREICQKAGYPIRDLAMVIPPDYRDAAEFEARVSRCIAGNASELDMISNNLQFLDGFKAKSLAWYILREARIAVEEEMDECLSPRL